MGTGRGLTRAEFWARHDELFKEYADKRKPIDAWVQTALKALEDGYWATRKVIQRQPLCIATDEEYWDKGRARDVERLAVGTPLGGSE